MKIKFHQNFEKKYKKLSARLKLKIKERNVLFAHNPFDALLNNHALKGKYVGYRSINITGDIRVVYKLIDVDLSLFVTIDTHSNLYK
ncbi:MAG TPA: type II toxin-antitoxin system mRNA interferase toxin, RelE/StbE family [Patescibacteria group bacterium]|nr:type II toxin-antitoxin system mRNA interferase toxin, RelE/StbE family [Patescibacteria group bacterium]